MVTDPWGAADASVLELEVTAGAGDVPTGAVDATGLPVPAGVAELATGGAAEVGYSLADEDELDDGAAAESGAALPEVSGLAVDEGLGPGTSTWTFGGAPSGCGITMIGPTRTGPTCIGPTVTGAGGSSVAPGGVVELTRGAVFELGVEFVRRGVWVIEVPAGGATSGREAVAEGASVR